MTDPIKIVAQISGFKAEEGGHEVTLNFNAGHIDALTIGALSNERAMVAVAISPGDEHEKAL